MTLPRMFEYLTHRISSRSIGPTSSSCFDEDQAPIWPYRYHDLATDLGRRSPLVVRASVEVPPGRNLLRASEIVSNIRLEIEVEGRHIRLEGVELTLVTTSAIEDAFASSSFAEAKSA